MAWQWKLTCRLCRSTVLLGEDATSGATGFGADESKDLADLALRTPSPQSHSLRSRLPVASSMSRPYALSTPVGESGLSPGEDSPNTAAISEPSPESALSVSCSTPVKAGRGPPTPPQAGLLKEVVTRIVRSNPCSLTTLQTQGANKPRKLSRRSASSPRRLMTWNRFPSCSLLTLRVSPVQ